MADSSRWERFVLRPDDVIITTPSKCGTTWMQTIVGMLLLGRVDLGAPISTISPWLDMLLHSEDETFSILEAQRHRRFIKTHTPLDGLPRHDGVTYVAVVRHPLDVALSDRDHEANQRIERAAELRAAVLGVPWTSPFHADPPPDDPAAYLRWFIDNDEQPTGSGPHGLADFCQQVGTYWEARDEANVHLFHYQDLSDDLDGEMRRVAAALGAAIDESRWPDLVAAATFDAMRARAPLTAPHAHIDLWRAPEQFFRVGGRRDWSSLLDDADLAHFHHRLSELAGDAVPWILHGRCALEGGSGPPGGVV